MNRNLLLRWTLPSLVIGLCFFAVCLLSIRYIHRLQQNLAAILNDNVRSLQAAQELEIRVRQLRLHNLLYLLDPKPSRIDLIEKDQIAFEKALEIAKQSSTAPDEVDEVLAIEKGYQDYKREQEELRSAAHGKPDPEAYKLADSHPVNSVVTPCQDLLLINKDKMSQSADESQRVSEQGYLWMILLGLAGPIGGVVVGYGITRGIRQSIYRLSVRVQDMAHHLERDFGSVSMVADGDMRTLEEQMRYIVPKVEQAARQLREQQRELLRTEQLSLVGQLAAGVAHEIRNPLTGIKLLVEAGLRSQAPRSLNQEDLQMIVREIKRLERTVQSFLNFARLPTPQTVPCDLRAIVQQATELVRTRAGEQKVDLVLQLPADPVTASVDSGQINTVLVNLLVNALDVMGQGGTLEVSLTAPDSGHVRLSVSDQGPGIPADIKDKLFQPFTTNKPHGTGLGLYLSSRILEEHGGSIAARNQPAGGACFTLTLPAQIDGGRTP
jgi:signal transduction histidine kinase